MRHIVKNGLFVLDGASDVMKTMDDRLLGRTVRNIMECHISGKLPTMTDVELDAYKKLIPYFVSVIPYVNGNQNERSSKRAIEWRIAVFKRDGYKCAICSKTGKKLNAHHIKPWAVYPEYRFDLNNGITLCEHCHKELHKKLRMKKKFGG